MDGHNHLDRRVRTRGECAGCDQFWDRQDERLTDLHVRRSVTAQLDKMAARPQRPGGVWCHVMIDKPSVRGVETHTCDLPAHHPPPHHCAACDITWP